MNKHTTLRSARLARLASVPALIAVTGLLGGCTLFNRGAVRQPSSIDIQSEDGSGQINLNDGSVTFQGNDEDSQSSFSFGSASLAEGWPSNLPTPSNATVVFSGKTTEDDGSIGYSATFSSTESGTSVLADLKSKFQASGWTVSDDYSGDFGGVLTGGFNAEQGENSAVVVLASDSSSSTPGAISITISGSFAQ